MLMLEMLSPTKSLEILALGFVASMAMVTVLVVIARDAPTLMNPKTATDNNIFETRLCGIALIISRFKEALNVSSCSCAGKNHSYISSIE